MAVRVFTVPIPLDVALGCGLSIQWTFGGVHHDIDSGVLAYPTLPAGKYPLTVFMAKTNALLRQWILDAATTASITTRPSLANVLLKHRFPTALTAQPNANKFSVTFDPTGFAIGGNAAVLTGFSLENTSGYWTRLGFVRETLTTLAGTINTNVATVNAEGQCRSLFVLERSDEDLGEREIYPSWRTMSLRDGSVRQHIYGASHYDRTITLIDHDDLMAGERLPTATLAASPLDGTRSILTLQSTDENGLVGASSLYQNDDLIVAGNYCRVGATGHVTRISARSGTPATSVTLLDKVPASQTQDMSGMTLYRVSEYTALFRRAKETGYVIVHEPDDTTGGTRWMGTAYAPKFDGQADPSPRRSADGFFDLWTAVLPLRARDVSELSLV